MLALLLASSSDAVGSAVAGGFSLVYCGCWAIAALLGIALFIFWILMLVDCIKRDEADFPNSTGNTKTIWLVILLASWLLSAFWLGAIVYYFMVKRPAGKKPAMPQAPPAPPTPPAA
jgi:hypothetical protein